MLILPLLQKVITNFHTFYFTLFVRIVNLFIVRSAYNTDEWWQTVEVAHNVAFGMQVIPFLQKVIINNHTLYFILIVRILNLFVVRTAFSPDEWWQSMEIAHKFVFGTGYLTWEWKYGIRSYLYVAFVALIYKILELLHLDYQYMVILMPRVAQTILSAYADLCFVEMVRRESNVKQAAYALYTYTTCWFIAFNSTRTLINAVELNLTCIGLYYYPFQKQHKSGSKFLWIVALVCALRPTAAIVWIPLCLFHIYESEDPVKLIIKTYLSIGVTAFTLSTLLDSYFYGSLVFTSFRFLWINVYRNVSSWYGTHPFSWYLTQGLPVNVGFFIIPLLRGPSKLNTVTIKLLSSLLFGLLIYSLIPHKEFRFILPLMPAMMFIISDRMLVWFSSLKNQFVGNWILIGLAAVNFKALIYFGVFHQSGTLAIMEKVPLTPDTDLLILTSCHSTPLYSHLHANISTRIITCDPNIEESDDFVDVNGIFWDNPQKWLETEYGNRSVSELPTHIICFEDFIEHIESFLSMNNYKEVENLWHSWDMRICLFERQKKDCALCDQSCQQTIKETNEPVYELEGNCDLH